MKIKIAAAIVLLSASTAVAQEPPLERQDLSPRFGLDPAKKALFEEIEKARRTPPLPEPPEATERLSVRGVVHSVVDGSVFIAIEVDAETLAQLPWLPRVSRVEDLDDGVVFEGRIYGRYLLDGPSEAAMTAAIGKIVELDLVRDAAGQVRALFARFP